MIDPAAKFNRQTRRALEQLAPAAAAADPRLAAGQIMARSLRYLLKRDCAGEGCQLLAEFLEMTLSGGALEPPSDNT